MKVFLVLLLASVLTLGYFAIFHPGLIANAFWGWWHRNSCGRQPFETLRCEPIARATVIGFDGRLLEMTKWDLRVQCPMCSRVHRVVTRSASVVPQFFDDDE